MAERPYTEDHVPHRLKRITLLVHTVMAYAAREALGCSPHEYAARNPGLHAWMSIGARDFCTMCGFSRDHYASTRCTGMPKPDPKVAPHYLAMLDELERMIADSDSRHPFEIQELRDCIAAIRERILPPAHIRAVGDE